MPCHPHQLTRPSATSSGTTSALLDEVAGQGAVKRREVARGIIADNLLTAATISRIWNWTLAVHPAAPITVHAGATSGVIAISERRAPVACRRPPPSGRSILAWPAYLVLGRAAPAPIHVHDRMGPAMHLKADSGSSKFSQLTPPLGREGVVRWPRYAQADR